MRPAKSIRTESRSQAAKGAWRIRTAVLVLGISFLYVTPADASTGDGWRWARYDQKPVKVKVVIDKTVSPDLLPVVKTAAAAWEQTGDLKLETPARPVADCSRETKPNTVCIAGDDGSNCGPAIGCFLPGPATGATADGLALFSYSRVWIRGDYGPQGNLRLVCHELGHAIGLGHTEDGPPSGPSCMSNGEFSTSPSSEDLQFLRQLYAARDVKAAGSPREAPHPHKEKD